MNESRNVLIKGDISGIQDFIFNVKSDGAAKSLKGRSFFIKILTEITIQYLLDVFQISENQRNDCRISTSGGNFLLKLPKKNNSSQLIDAIQHDLSVRLRFSGINVAVNSVEFDDSNYSACLIKLNKKIRENKLGFYNNITPDTFEKVLKTNTKNNFIEIDDNNNWQKVTHRIKSERFFSIIKSGQIKYSNDLKIDNDSIELVGYKCQFHSNNSNANKVCINNYLEHIFPLNKNETIKEFEDLANDGKGDSKLGVLKMDVDDLGLALENVKNIDEHKIFDYKLKEFFNKKIDSLINSQFNNAIYTVSAGGDDSFFVGHWEKIIKLASHINEDFTKTPYFKNLGLSISAGYIIIKPKFPVIRFAQLAEEALHKAKYDYDKGNICIFGEVISWRMLKKVFDLKRILLRNVDKKSKGLLAKVRQSAIKGIDKDQITLKENWEIAYYLRDIKNESVAKKLMEQIRENIRLSVQVDGNSMQEKKEKRNLRMILPIAARLTELEKR